MWNNVPITTTKIDSNNLQWNNNTTSPTHTQQWSSTTTPPTHTQQWNNTATPTNAQWNNSVTMSSSAQWNSTPVTANQSLEAQQTRRENLMLQNEIERLRQQLQQQQQQSMNASANDAWMTQQNQQLHQQVAQLTQEVQNTCIYIWGEPSCLLDTLPYMAKNLFKCKPTLHHRGVATYRKLRHMPH